MKPATPLSPCKSCIGRHSPNRPAARCAFCRTCFCFTHLTDPKTHPCLAVQQKAQPKAAS